MSVAVVGDLLRKEAFTDDVVKSFVDNKISLPIFMDLNNEDFKELGILALGDRKKLKNLIAKLQNHEQRGIVTGLGLFVSESDNLFSLRNSALSP